MQIIATILSITCGSWSLTKHNGSISSVTLRKPNTQGSCAEAGLLRKEFGFVRVYGSMRAHGSTRT